MLSDQQVMDYKRNGFVAPIDIYNEMDISAIRSEVELAEKRWGDHLNESGRNNAHYVLPVLDRIAHDPRILDAVEQLIGKDILVCGTTLFFKEPETKGFISWHQDARYVGLEPHNWVTAWLAISDTNEQNGCMRMIPGSHVAPLRDHIDTYDDDNILTRGQTVPDIDENDSVPVPLKAGQMSLHHPRIVHGSGANLSQTRRMGFAIQSYIGGDVRQVRGKIWVQQARGTEAGEHHLTGRPTSEMSEKDVAFRTRANQELSKIFYENAAKKGKY